MGSNDATVSVKCQLAPAARHKPADLLLASMTDDVVILEEDTSHEPTRQDIIDYALYIGMELPRDEHLLWIATEGLKAPLPPRWKAVRYMKDNEEDQYYFNFKTGESQWEHPCDQFYRDLYAKEKEKEAKAAASAGISAAVTSGGLETGNNDPLAVPRQSKAPLQPVSKDRLILGKLPSMDRKLDNLKTLPVNPSKSLSSSLDKGKATIPNALSASSSRLPADERKAFDDWVVKEKERIEAEREDWASKRAQETEAWIQARTAEIEAERQNRILELRHQVEEQLSQMKREYEHRVQQQREKLDKEQIEHEKELEIRRVEWLDAIKEGVAKKEMILNQRIAELQQVHQDEISRLKKELQAKIKTLEIENEETLKIQACAIESRKAELNVRLEHLEIEGREQEKRKRQEWETRLKQIERDGKEKCLQIEEHWASEGNSVQQKALNASNEKRIDVEDLKKTNEKLEKTIAELQSSENAKVAQLTRTLDEFTEKNASLNKKISELEKYYSDTTAGKDLLVSDLEKRLQESENAYNKVCQERDDLSREFEEHKLLCLSKQQNYPSRQHYDRNEQSLHSNSEESECEGETGRAKVMTDYEIEQVFESELSDISDMSDAEFNSINTRWNCQLQKEQTSIDHGRKYLIQEKKILTRAKQSIMKDQEKWKRDRQKALTANNGSLPASIERDIRWRKRLLDSRTRRLNSDISRYLKMKRSLESRQNGLYCLQKDASVSSSLPDPNVRLNSDSTTQEATKAMELKPWAAAAAIPRPFCSDAKATLNSHSEWLKSFRSEIRKNSASTSDLPGTSAPRYLLQKNSSVRPSHPIAIPAASTNNDITIRIKVEK